MTADVPEHGPVSWGEPDCPWLQTAGTNSTDKVRPETPELCSGEDDRA